MTVAVSKHADANVVSPLARTPAWLHRTKNMTIAKGA